MEPIFRSFYDLPSRPRHTTTARPVPVQAQPGRVMDRPHRVVSIPVRFVESERTRSDAAVKIQKAFRGFFVRKSLKKISAIKEEVMAIEQRMSKEESVDLLRRNSRERFSVNETLMSLLLRLDSVRAADAGVRDFRRSVIRKAIALQEQLDAIVQPEDEKVGSHHLEEVVEAVEASEEPGAHGTEIAGSVSEHNCDAPANEDVMGQFSEISHDSETNNVADSELVAEDFDKNEILEDAAAVESQSGSTQSPAGEEEVNDCEAKGGIVKEESQSEGEELRGSTEAEDDRNRELLKRMVKESETMMGIMAELVQKNEKQTRLLSSLTQRVEQLERAFVCDKLRRMKKRSAAAGCVDGYEKSPAIRKNGKR